MKRFAPITLLVLGLVAGALVCVRTARGQNGEPLVQYGALVFATLLCGYLLLLEALDLVTDSFGDGA